MLAYKDTYVAYWIDRDTGEVQFAYNDEWGPVREILDFHTRGGRASEGARRLVGQLGRLNDDHLRGLARDPVSGQPGFYRAHRFALDREPDVFALARKPGTPHLVPIVAPAEVVEAELNKLRRSVPNLEVERATLSEDPLRPPKTIPSQARRTAPAQRAFDRIGDGVAVRAAIVGLTVEELTWLGHALGRARMRAEFLFVAALALRRRRDISTLNLCGSAYRLDWPSQSEALFRESIEMEEDARDNPYAWIGLAASLRRLHEHDEAYDCLKRVRRWYPENEYAMNLERAIRREMRGFRAFRTAREEDESPSLIEDLPLRDPDELWSPEEWV